MENQEERTKPETVFQSYDMRGPEGKNCPKCGSEPKEHEVRNFDRVWRDGDVYCTKCNTYVRMYDAG
jgi:hypothetical protein